VQQQEKVIMHFFRGGSKQSLKHSEPKGDCANMKNQRKIGSEDTFMGYYSFFHRRGI
jgi:hypothetical protein